MRRRPAKGQWTNMTQTDADSMPSTSATPRSLRALLTAVIDYAGLFPPATLELPAVINNYSNYLQSPDAWMLGRLIVPAAKLDELEKRAAGVLPKNADDEPWRISALVKSAADEDVLPAM